METVKCSKCDGRGKLTYHLHIADGVCFACKGSGSVAVRAPRAQKPRAPDRNYACARVGFEFGGDRAILELKSGEQWALVAFVAGERDEVRRTLWLDVAALARGEAKHNRDLLTVGAASCRALWPAVALAAAPHVAELRRRAERLAAVIASTVAPDGDDEIRRLGDARAAA